MNFSPVSELNKNCFNILYGGFGLGQSNPAYYHRAFTAVEVGNDAAIYLAGFDTSWQGQSVDYGNILLKLLSTGNLDMGYMMNQGTGFSIIISSVNSPIINKILLEPDNSSVIGGYFNTFNGINSYSLIKLKRDGTKDTSFFSTALPTGSTINDIKKQSDGKYIIGGKFTTYSGVTKNCICRINSDGTLDATFDVGTGFSAGYGLSINSIDIQSDGKIVVCGMFNSYNGTTVYQICRLNTNGTLDNTFTTSTNTDIFQYKNKVIVLSDDKILVCGNFSTYLSNTAPGFAKLNSNGTFFGSYTGYTLPSSNDSITTIGLQSDGKIILAPWIPGVQLLRLNSDLTLDSNFIRQYMPSINANGPTYYNIGFSKELLQDIYIVGEYMNVSGSTYSISSAYVTKLGPNGELKNCIYDPPLNIEYKITNNFTNSPSYTYAQGISFILSNNGTCTIAGTGSFISGTTYSVTNYTSFYTNELACTRYYIKTGTNLSFYGAYIMGGTGSYTFKINGNVVSTNTFTTTGASQTLFTYPYSSISNGQKWELITNISYV